MATIGQLLKRAGNGAKSLGQAVHAAAQGVVQPRNPAATAPGPESTLDQPQMADFHLPGLGDAPDPNDPKYTSENSPAGGYENDLADYQHKQEVHKAFEELDRIYKEAHPQRDFKGEYQQELGALGKDPGFAPEGSFLKRFALALGDFNPAVQQTTGSNLSAADKRQSGYDEKKRELLRKMTEQKASDAEARGNFSTALKQQEMLQLLDFEQERRLAKDKADLTTQHEQALTERMTAREAAIKERVLATVRQRQDIADKDVFAKEFAKNFMKRYGPIGMLQTIPALDVNDLQDEIHDALEAYQKAKSGKTSAPAGSLDQAAEPGADDEESGFPQARQGPAVVPGMGTPQNKKPKKERL